MGLLALVLIVLVILAVIGLGWKTFSSGIINGFETVLDVGPPIIKNLTHETREYVNSLNLILLGL
ncbi:MAG: hypothetical protein ACRD8Z_03270 [Nitrososphaeraceae archaeon]